MKTKTAVRLVTALAIAGLASGQTAPRVPNTAAWNLGHGNAKVMVGLDFKSLRESKLGQLLGSQMRSQMPQQAGPMAMALPLVMQALNDVDRVFISSPSVGPGPAGNKTKAADNPPFLVVMEGRFGPGSPLGFFMTGTPKTYKGVNVYEPPATDKTNNMNLALLNEGTLLIGDPASLHGAIDRQGQATGGIPLAMRARASALATGHDFWIVLQDSLGSLPSNPALAGAASEIEGLEFGLGLREGIQLDVMLTAKTEDTAKMMSQMLLSQLQSAVSSSQIDNAQAAELASKLQVSSEGKQLRLRLQLTADELEHQFRAMQTQRSLAQTMQTQPKPRMAAAKIKIYGLDEGPREIEVKR